MRSRRQQSARKTGMALKGSLAKAGELLEDITIEFHRPGEFVSKPDWIETAKGQARITGSKIFLLTQTLR
jgi:hypothetical protein